MIKKIALTLTLVTILMLSACAAAPSPSYSPVEPAGMPESREYEDWGAAPSNGESGFAYDQSAQTQRIVIKEASLRMAVADPVASMDRIQSLAEEYGGFVVSARLYQTRLENGVEVPEATVTIRVRAENLDAALARIKAETDKPVISENISSSDVTREYTDLESRLRNLQATEAQLQEIMSNARTTEDVLSVYNELTRVREQIEMIQGQIQYYQQASALSSISVALVANESVVPLTIGGWEPAGVAKSAIQSLINALKGFATALIWLALFLLPLLVIIVLPLYLLGRGLRSLRRGKSRPTE